MKERGGHRGGSPARSGRRTAGVTWQGRWWLEVEGERLWRRREKSKREKESKRLREFIEKERNGGERKKRGREAATG